MGTNFYAKRIPTSQEIKEAKAKLGKMLIGALDRGEFNEYLDKVDTWVHLGKRSYGWQFLWQENKDYYDSNLKSIKEFLKQPNWEIYDEYDRKFTVKQFFEEEIGESLYNNPEKYINLEQYYNKHPNEFIISTDHEYNREDGLRFAKGDFS